MCSFFFHSSQSSDSKGCTVLVVQKLLLPEIDSCLVEKSHVGTEPSMTALINVGLGKSFKDIRRLNNRA